MASMIRRTASDGSFEYWSRLGWSDVYAMKLDDAEASAQCAGWQRQFPTLDVRVVPYQQPTVERRPRTTPYYR
ncbi:hypothetical protein [Schlesneria sp.]|uniref:hypothetical protein n=1 Tax=Schlesneria sp. TaxID=2762018 RepID=UPI002EFB706A